MPHLATHFLIWSATGDTVDVDAPLMDAGIDSLGAVELRNQLQQALGAVSEGAPALSSVLVFDHPTTRQLAEALQELVPEESDEASKPAAPGLAPSAPEQQDGGAVMDIEIGGVSCKLPGAAEDVLDCLHISSYDAIVQVPGR